MNDLEINVHKKMVQMQVSRTAAGTGNGVRDVIVDNASVVRENVATIPFTQKFNSLVQSENIGNSPLTNLEIERLLS